MDQKHGVESASSAPARAASSTANRMCTGRKLVSNPKIMFKGGAETIMEWTQERLQLVCQFGKLMGRLALIHQIIAKAGLAKDGRCQCGAAQPPMLNGDLVQCVLNDEDPNSTSVMTLCFICVSYIGQTFDDVPVKSIVQRIQSIQKTTKRNPVCRLSFFPSLLHTLISRVFRVSSCVYPRVYPPHTHAKKALCAVSSQRRRGGLRVCGLR